MVRALSVAMIRRGPYTSSATRRTASIGFMMWTGFGSSTRSVHSGAPAVGAGSPRSSANMNHYLVLIEPFRGTRIGRELEVVSRLLLLVLSPSPPLLRNGRGPAFRPCAPCACVARDLPRSSVRDGVRHPVDQGSGSRRRPRPSRDVWHCAGARGRLRSPSRPSRGGSFLARPVAPLGRLVAPG